MNDRQLIIDAMVAAGVEDAGKPRSRNYVNTRYLQAEEPDAETAEPEPEPSDEERPRTTSTRPVPTDHTPAPTPTGGHEPRPLVVDHSREVRELADKHWRRLHG